MRIFRLLSILTSALLALCLLCAPCAALAHAGGQDSQGGHNSPDGYHYHHGFPAHEHIDGICPYWGGPYTPGEENPDYALEPVEPWPTAGAESQGAGATAGVPASTASPTASSSSSAASSDGEEAVPTVPVYREESPSPLLYAGLFAAGALVGGVAAWAAATRRARRESQQREALFAAELQRLRGKSGPK